MREQPVSVLTYFLTRKSELVRQKAQTAEKIEEFKISLIVWFFSCSSLCRRLVSPFPHKTQEVRRTVGKPCWIWRSTGCTPKRILMLSRKLWRMICPRLIPWLYQ